MAETTGNTSDPNRGDSTQTAANAAKPVDVVQLTGDMVNNPTLPSGTTVSVTQQVTSKDEFLKDQIPKSAATYTAAPSVIAGQSTAGTATAGIATAAQSQASKSSAAQASAAQASTAGINNNFQQQAAQAGYESSLTGIRNAQQGTAQVGVVSDQATVQGQLKSLNDFSQGTPAWAQGAMNKANEAMAARGLGASSIAGQAIIQALMESSVPIATADAETFAKMNLQNLDNRQQMELQNAKSRQEILLSDTSFKNAQLQFNAQDKSQTAQFFSGLMADIDKANMMSANDIAAKNAELGTQSSISNADLGTRSSMSNAELATQASTSTAQFATQASTTNAELATQSSISNATLRTNAAIDGAQRADAANKSNAEQENAMMQFFGKQQLVVDQSNAEWRRNVNTANTAAVNAANQVNAANRLGISNTAMNNLWQASRDSAAWANQSAENEMDRAFNLALASFNKDANLNILSIEQKNTLYSSLGSFATDILKAFLTRKG